MLAMAAMAMVATINNVPKKYTDIPASLCQHYCESIAN
jgi:hypothetical protein